MRKFLKAIYVIQIENNTERKARGLKHLGRGYSEAYRLNPFNPLSYVTFILAFVVGVLMFGFVGLWKEVDSPNPFKWN